MLVRLTRLPVIILLFLSHFSLLHAQPLPLFNEGREQLETILQRFDPPPGYSRVPLKHRSFGTWLRNMPVLPDSSPVLDFRGRIRVAADDSSLAAVVAVRIRSRGLDQCMDILMRLYTGFLYERNEENAIVWPLPDGLPFSWTKWKEGYRPRIAGSRFYLDKTAGGHSRSRHFERYLRTIFDYTGTQAFYHYYRDIPADSVRPGDFFVKKGRNGHAVLVVDMVENGRGRQRALIGQGDTPACQFYILNGTDGNPWIDLTDRESPLALPIRKKMGWDGLRRF